MKTKRTYTLPNLSKVETLTEEQRKQISIKQHSGSTINTLEQYYSNQESPPDKPNAIVEINVNYDGTIKILLP